MKGFMTFLLMGMFSVSVLAQVPVVDTKAISGSVSLGVQSKYVSPFSGAVFTDGSVMQDEVSVSLPWFDVTVWNSSSLERRAGKTDGDEIDYIVSRSDSFFLGKRVDVVSVEYGVSYYDFSKLCSGNKNDAMAYFAEASRRIKSLGGIISPDLKIDSYMRFEADVATANSEFEGGTFTTLGIRGEAGKSDNKGLVDLGFTRDDGAYGLEPDWVLSYKLSFEVVKVGWTFTPNFMLTAPFHGESQIVFGLSASREF